MKLSYAICVCNEDKELYSLLNFLKKVKDNEDEINVLVDSAHVTEGVRKVLKYFEADVVQNDRDFDGKFATHRNYHIEKCTGDYIFQIDADEMPQEALIKNLKQILINSTTDALVIPRINIHPGSTDEWIKRCKFNVNEIGWINWPDQQYRIFRRSPEIRYNRELHEMLVGAERVAQVPNDPQLALWHIKTVEKQDSRWDSVGNYVLPKAL
jgi:glycosyltransferase involved in cell wall biosynthesis